LRYKRPDRKNALSLVEAAKRDMKFTLSMKLTEESGATIVRNIYECFRKLGDSLLVAKGIDSEDHISPIRKLLQIKAKTTRSINLIDNLRRLRININYYGYKPNLIEVKDSISIAESCFEPLHTGVLKKIG
jgi:hypothetical protein